MKIALVYDEPMIASEHESLPEDIGAEFESVSAIEGLSQALEVNDHEVVHLPFSGDFFTTVKTISPDLVFNIAEGIRGPGRESIVPAWLDHLEIPYTGSDGLTLAVTLDKSLTKTIVSSLGIYTPAYKRINSLSDLAQINLEFPLFIKPNAEGSSMGIRHSSMVTSQADLERQVAWVLDEYRQDCLIEEFVPGREFCVAILGNDDPQILPIAEIINPGDFYSYEEKSQHHKRVQCPADITDEIHYRMTEAALAIYHVLWCRDLARLDFKFDSNGSPAFLEINPLPGLARDYGIFPFQARAADMSYDQLIEKVVQLAWERAVADPGNT